MPPAVRRTAVQPASAKDYDSRGGEKIKETKKWGCFMDEYKTVRQFAETEYEDRKSRFIAAVTPVGTEAEALEFIAARKAMSPDARHHVYAYILRDNNTTRYSDDGEPHSTAGMPTLDVLRKQGLTDCCVVTTRYFGGILLGTGGLVRAYTAAAGAAVETAGIAVMRECVHCRVTCSYADYERAGKTVQDCGGKIIDTAFGENAELRFSVAADAVDRLNERFRETFCGVFLPEIVGNGYMEV